MAVEFQPDQTLVKESAQSVAPARQAAKVAVTPQTSQKSSEATPAKASVSQPPETNVAFRRDNNGQIYYVFTDAESGRELQELPPKQVRAVGQGIADLVKELQQKNSNHLEVKG